MRLPNFLTSIHKWIGLVIGIQVLLWVLGGLVMSAFPIELVRGETQAAPAAPVAIGAGEFRADLREALAARGPVTGLRTMRVAGRLYFEVQRGDSPSLLIDAADGSLLDGIDEATARTVAEADFRGR